MPELRNPTDEFSPEERQRLRHLMGLPDRALNVWLAFLLTVIFGSIAAGVVFGVRWENVWRMFQ